MSGVIISAACDTSAATVSNGARASNTNTRGDPTVARTSSASATSAGPGTSTNESAGCPSSSTGSNRAHSAALQLRAGAADATLTVTNAPRWLDATHASAAARDAAGIATRIGAASALATAGSPRAFPNAARTT